MNYENPTFNDLPQMVAEINRKVDILLTLLTPLESRDADKYMSLEQLINFLPEKPAKQTVYQWVNERKIPYKKFGRKLYFLRSGIQDWLDNARQKQ